MAIRRSSLDTGICKIRRLENYDIKKSDASKAILMQYITDLKNYVNKLADTIVEVYKDLNNPNIRLPGKLDMLPIE